MRKYKKVVISLALVASMGVGSVFGVRYLRQNNVEPIKVYPFDFVGMTEYWGDTKESYGPVTTDKIQTVYLSDTQTVSEILVEDGQEVKKGDLLLSFDTTLSQLELERKGLDIQHSLLAGDKGGGNEIHVVGDAEQNVGFVLLAQVGARHDLIGEGHALAVA